MKNNKKAFTLVELLVVISILAILATVTIIGYTSFTKRARNSNAVSELSQAKSLILADTRETPFVYDFGTPEDDSDDQTIEYVVGEKFVLTGVSTDGLDAFLKAAFPELAQLTGTFTTSDSYDEITEIKYLLEDGGEATWDIIENEVK